MYPTPAYISFRKELYLMKVIRGARASNLTLTLTFWQCWLYSPALSYSHPHSLDCCPFCVITLPQFVYHCLQLRMLGQRTSERTHLLTSLRSFISKTLNLLTNSLNYCSCILKTSWKCLTYITLCSMFENIFWTRIAWSIDKIRYVVLKGLDSLRQTCFRQEELIPFCHVLKT